MAHLFHWHWLAVVVKVFLGITVLLLSAILSYTFFMGIKPAGMDIFPFAALSLTEGGLVAWIIIFTTMKHHMINGLIAILMIIACFITTLVVTFAELIAIFQDHALVSNDTVRNGTLILLEIMLALHVLAAVSDFLIGKLEWLLKTLPLRTEHAPALTPGTSVHAIAQEASSHTTPFDLPDMTVADQGNGHQQVEAKK